jgi:hypothetical protein
LAGKAFLLSAELFLDPDAAVPRAGGCPAYKKHKRASILDFITPIFFISDIELLGPTSDHSYIGLNFDIGYRID